jgi:3-phenylpropionate/trans-cinnamate dioxygenase ferredoxin reductase component
MAGVVIVGGGQAGLQAAVSLRDEGYEESIALIGDEPAEPYQRPPLSKAYLLDEMTDDRLALRAPAFYGANNIDLIIGQAVTSLDRASKRLTLSSGSTLEYRHLILATGARNRLLPLEGANLDGVHYLRTAAEANALRAALRDAAAVVVIGAGFIGLELAAVAAKLGKKVFVVESAVRCMSRSVSRAISHHVAKAHAGWGTEFLFGATPVRLVGVNGRVTSIALSDQRMLPADLVLVGIGVHPNVELARANGLPVENGIVVDATLATKDSNIFAIGDCAAFPSPLHGNYVRLESVQNAVDQARSVAKRIVGRSATYSAVPWFWSDQGSLKLQMVGLTAGHDRTVIRGNPEEGSFSVFCYRGDLLLGIESVNRPADHVFGRRLLAACGSITPEQASDLSFDMKAKLNHLESAKV